MILLNILVLVFEILYYSMFMYYAKGEGKFKRYLLLFSLITIIGLFIGTNYLYSYLMLFIMIVLGMKYIIKIKSKTYDKFFIYIMFLFKVIIEMILSYPIYFIVNNIYIATIIVGIIKNLLIYFNKLKIKNIYKKLNNVWNKNNFYIRYIFGILGIFYIMLSCIYLIIECI